MSNDMRTEHEARDAALNTLERPREELIRIGRATATDIAQRNGTVTSIDVTKKMREDTLLRQKMDRVDARWLGAVFRAGSVWKRVGYENTGSHGRPVAIWQLRQPLETKSA